MHTKSLRSRALSEIQSSRPEPMTTRPVARPSPTIAFQRNLGNRSVQRLAETGMPQAKITVNQPGDRYEREADRVADAVMRMPSAAAPEVSLSAAPGAQRACTACASGQGLCPACEEEGILRRVALAGTDIGLIRQQSAEPEEEEEQSIQAKEAAGRTPVVSRGLQAQIQSLRGGGRPLPASERSFFEPRFGRDFSRVRVHTDARATEAARAVSARAFTIGRDLVFGSGQYTPGTSEGRRLLAHELTHVVQQRAGGSSARDSVVQRQLKCGIDHVKDECDNAAATCQSVQDSYCRKKYPKSSDIETLHGKAIIGALAKKKSIPHAAENLLHYLRASGSEKVMPVDIFKNHKATQHQLKHVHRDRFKKGAEKRLKDGRLTVGGSVEMVWTDTANAFSFLKEDDLGLAVGGYTLCSKVKVSATGKVGGSVKLIFDSWTVQAFDCYNWDPGKGIGGLFGGVKDNDLCCLENANKGRHFRARTDPWTSTIAAGSFTIATTAPSTPEQPKPDPLPKPGDDR